jgi:elongation factor P
MPKACDVKKGNVVEIQVPEYLESGEMVRVNKETRKFMSRA